MFRTCIYLLLFLVASCRTAPVKQEQEILALKEINELVTVEYIVNKIIKASDDKTWYKIGDRKILMTCEATLKAGIDFSSLNAEHIQVNNKQVTLTLPHASLFSVSIKPEDIKVAYEEIGAFRSSFTTQERDALAAQAQQQIEDSADSLGVLQTAEANASLFASRFLRNMGYEKVIVQFGKKPVKLN
ncbi:DUF4230 domain-containing protein [Agriterribacter sp.]|uniref:DUF4230 domain-containing protein n=1 Tax=Agriterribacter sp. TaxID=2821509 RepID=UPI002C43F2D4|nr:DUF4230 domain-containing protein [Agriterribacter sp.]HRP55339.1 DUF4230 domain-containing protein [Agriterribacter sp.]